MEGWYKKWWGILIIFLVSMILIFIIASGFYIANLVKEIKNNQLASGIIKNKSLTQEELRKIEGENNYWIGSASPKVTIVEFSDFACPYCQKSFSKIREISLKYKKDVKIIYRDYPLRDGSMNLAMAGRCAGEQGLFWLMHDKLFQNQGVSMDEEMIELAKQIGADVKKFEQCQKDKKYTVSIQKDYLDGQDLGIKGTPTWFINGYKVEGDIPYSMFIDTVEKLIKI